MSGDSGERPAFRHRSAEVGVALFVMAIGAVIAAESVRIGARWTADGPQTGYFPFYIGLIVCAASAINLGRALFIEAKANATFVQVGQLRTVLAVLAPTAVFVALVGWLGMYASAVLYMALFMRWLGKYPWWKVCAASAATGVALFLLFEWWFLVPLPKGPLERLLGVG
jgi:hypothetical protein